MTPDRLQLMVMALPAPRAVRLSQTWGSGLAGSGGGYSSGMIGSGPMNP